MLLLVLAVQNGCNVVPYYCRPFTCCKYAQPRLLVAAGCTCNRLWMLHHRSRVQTTIPRHTAVILTYGCSAAAAVNRSNRVAALYAYLASCSALGHCCSPRCSSVCISSTCASTQSSRACRTVFNSSLARDHSPSACRRCTASSHSCRWCLTGLLLSSKHSSSAMLANTLICCASCVFKQFVVNVVHRQMECSAQVSLCLIVVAFLVGEARFLVIEPLRIQMYSDAVNVRCPKTWAHVVR
jgi:hypothetical protein